MGDYYEMMGVDRAASHDTIHRAYRQLARRLHPDVSRGNTEREVDMQLLNQAWEVLGDPIARDNYDRSLGIETREFLLRPSLVVPPGFSEYGGQSFFAAMYRYGDEVRNRLSLSADTADLTGLADVPDDGLWRLSLHGRPVVDADLRALTRFHTIEELELGSTSVTDAGLVELVGRPMLRVLNLARCHITDAGMEQFARMPALEELILFHTDVTDAGLRALAFHPELAVLDLRGTRVSGDALAPLLTVPELHELRLPRGARRHARRFGRERPDVRIL